MILKENYTLSNGIEIPKLGLGTWFIDNDEVANAVKEAVALGYRHIDTAQAYGNEAGVGQGIRECGVERGELFVTTKLAAEIKSYDEAVLSIENSLKTLGLDYIDSMIIHSPKPWADFLTEEPHFEGNNEAWRALEEAYEAGKLKSIGVSNFDVADLENILKNCTVKPMVNQILAHITKLPLDVIEFCKENNILIEAYSPIGHGELFKNEEVVKMAERLNVSLPQLAIRFCLQLGFLPLPKTANPKHMQNNADVDFEISEADMTFLTNLEQIKDYGDAKMFPVYSK